MTNVSNFIVNNSGLLVAFLMAIVGLVGAIVSRNKQQVYTKIYALISQAQLLEGATGADKFEYVFDNAYKSLPWFIRFFISEDSIKMAIEYSLTKLKTFASSQVEAAKISASNNTAQINNTTVVNQVEQEKVIPDDENTVVNTSTPIVATEVKLYIAPDGTKLIPDTSVATA
jgi:hypothetical protein